MSNNNISKVIQSDIVISTRIRLARNLKEYPFPCRMNSETAVKVANEVKEALFSCGRVITDNFKFIDMNTITENEALSLSEKHYISREFAKPMEGRYLLLSNDGKISIMVNEEDHIRIQTISEGMNLQEAYELADKIDVLLSEKLNYAYNDRLGYLTQCPTNLGTGMRASFMLHLPALTKTSSINRISASLSKLGLIMRGFDGEGSKAKGALYQLSNQITLGLSEQNAMDNLNSIANQIISRERETQKEIVNNIDMVDIIYRSLGVLKNARLLSSNEAMDCISNVRLGICTGILKSNLSSDELNKILINIQPNTLILNNSNKVEPFERDEVRASITRKSFSETS